MTFIWQWVLKHWSSVGIGLLLCWVSIGVTYATFVKPSIKVSSGGTYVEASRGLEPTFGCATGRQFIGWAHQKDKR